MRLVRTVNYQYVHTGRKWTRRRRYLAGSILVGGNLVNTILMLLHVDTMVESFPAARRHAVCLYAGLLWDTPDILLEQICNPSYCMSSQHRNVVIVQWHPSLNVMLMKHTHIYTYALPFDRCIDYVWYYPVQPIPDLGTCGVGFCGGSLDETTALDDDSDLDRSFGYVETCDSSC